MRSSTMRERSSPTGITARTLPDALWSPSIELRHRARRHRIRGGHRRARDHFEIAVVHEPQQRRAAGHELPRLLQAFHDDAVERRAHHGAIDVEPRAIARDPRLLDVLLGHALARQRFFELALRHDIAERLQALALRGEQARAVPRDV